MSSQQKVVIITGASQGIGAELVRAYRDRHYRVVATSRSIQPSADPDVLAVAGDIADPETAERVVREALDRFGRIDALVNNAGIFTAKPFVDFTADDYAQNMGVNVAGFFHITQRTKSLAIEFAQAGIRVNAVAPGIIKTPMHPADTHAALSTLHPVGRMGEIRDIVDAVLYLETASFVTGEILHVDGGQNAGRW
ncbi:MAG: SDR family oxidoreductase [Sphingomonadales bacterium]|nr:MAG: SDR family oxidoreductase [Sphingomonadales bacterium]